MMEQASFSFFIAQLSRIFYGGPAAVWKAYSPEESDMLCEWALRHDLQRFFYFTSADALPPEWRRRFSAAWRDAAVGTLAEEVKLLALYRTLAAGQLRFAPIKGIDLAYRIYPESALRRHVDWDILFHPDDFGRAAEVLDRHNWLAPYAHSTSDHHSVPRCSGGYFLEAHYSLANFAKVDPHDIWRHISPCDAAARQHVLMPELNLLMLCRHAAADNYRHVFWGRLLLDIAYLLRAQKVDWQKLSVMCREWHLPYPGDILGAFPDFFAADLLQECRFERTEAGLFREMFDKQYALYDVSYAEMICNAPERYSSAWWFYRLQGISPSGIRMKYKLPASGAWGRVLRCWCCDIRGKAANFLHFTRSPNRRAQEYLQLAGKIEGKNER